MCRQNLLTTGSERIVEAIARPDPRLESENILQLFSGFSITPSRLCGGVSSREATLNDTSSETMETESTG
jgi:hypothetical protein